MKKFIFIILFIGADLSRSFAQCQCCGSSSGFSGGESTPGALTLEKNKWLGEMSMDLRSFNGISQKDNAEFLGVSNVSPMQINNMGIGVAGIRYGLNNKIILAIQQPLFWINTASLNSKTFGDLLSLVNYMPVNKPGIVIDVQAGMEWPTGQLVQISNGSSVSTGSGSFDPVAGFNIKKPFKRSFLRTSAFFKYTTKGFNQTYFGNFFGQQLNYTLFLTKRKNVCLPDTISLQKERPFVSVNVQLASEWSQMQIRNNEFLENTGSYVALGSFGATISFKGFSIPIMFSAPFYQRFHGEQNQTRFRSRIGITKFF